MHQTIIGKTKLNKKGFNTVIIIIAIFLLLFAGLATIYYYSNSKEKPKKITVFSGKVEKNLQIAK